jgi:hypothetical protein
MLMGRIIRAFTFRKEVYAEVEKDTSFTTTAWVLVVVVAFLNQLGTHASGNLVRWLLGTVVFTIVTVIAFATAAWVMNRVGRAVFHAEVTLDELVRTLGLAYVWQAVGVLGVVTVFSDALSCLLLPVLVIAWIPMTIAWFLAAKEALGLEWVQTIVTVVIGWIAYFVAAFAIGVLLSLSDLGAELLEGSVGV